MAGGINMGQALSLLGGVPVQPAGAKTIIEKLRAAKSMIPGEMGGLMNMVLSQGPASLLKNPMAALQTVMGGQLNGMMNRISSMVGGGPAALLGALGGAGGLTQALGSLNQVTGLLSGVVPAALGQNGLMQAIGHANMLSMFGDAVPAVASLERAMGPLLMGGRIDAMVGRLAAIEQGIVSGSLNPALAVSEVAGFTSEITRVLADSERAFTTIQASAVPLAQAAAVLSLVASGPAELAPIINSIIRDEHKAEIQAAMDEQIRA